MFSMQYLPNYRMRRQIANSIRGIPAKMKRKFAFKIEKKNSEIPRKWLFASALHFRQADDFDEILAKRMAARGRVFEELKKKSNEKNTKWVRKNEKNANRNEDSKLTRSQPLSRKYEFSSNWSIHLSSLFTTRPFCQYSALNRSCFDVLFGNRPRLYSRCPSVDSLLFSLSKLKFIVFLGGYWLFLVREKDHELTLQDEIPSSSLSDL